MYATVDKKGHFTGKVYAELTPAVQAWHDDVGYTWVIVDAEPEPTGEDDLGRETYGKPTTEQLADTVRYQRDAKIEAVRWRINRHRDELDLGLEPTEPLEPLLQYVQALRDVPAQAKFPKEVVWPIEPELPQ